MSSRDIEILHKIVRYCEEINEARSRFGDDFKSLQSDTLYRNATSMCILQIGELTSHLTDEFKSTYDKMPWQDIKSMRNIAAHHYGKFDTQKLWETISCDVPELKQYCEDLINQHS